VHSPFGASRRPPPEGADERPAGPIEFRLRVSGQGRHAMPLFGTKRRSRTGAAGPWVARRVESERGGDLRTVILRADEKEEGAP